MSSRNDNDAEIVRMFQNIYLADTLHFELYRNGA
jgi:hypothetical protein